MRTVFALDIGGTAIKLGLATDDGRVLGREQVAFDREQPVGDLVERIAVIYNAMQGETGHIDAVAVAMPGYPQANTGLIIDGGYNVPALREASIVQALREQLRLPVWFANDGVAAALGELNFGAGRTIDRFVLITIGTGIGGAVVLDGRAVIGRGGEPPELGAIVVGVDGAGRPLSLEGQSSAPAMLHAHERRTGDRPASAEALFELAAQGDAAAGATIDAACRGIAHAAGALINALALEAVVLGGGVSGAGEALVRRVRGHLPGHVWPSLAEKVEVRPAELGNSAGLLGVASLAFDKRSASAVHRRLGHAGIS